MNPGGKTSIPVVNEVRLRVRYAETDQMGVAYHSNHFIWFEVGRVELMRQLGFSYKDMERNDDCHMPVVDARCRYRVPVVYDEEIIVRTHLTNVRESMVHFSYELLRASDSVLLASGETKHIAVNSAKKISAFPRKYLTALRTAAGKRLL
ncbi:MAG: acyl-CoA thioesterase [Terriglobales bacterium]